MGFLRRPGKDGDAAWVFAAVLILTTTGCMIMRRYEVFQRAVPFSHDTHDEDEELACEDCHRKYAKSDVAGMPKMKQCMLCHEEIDEERDPAHRLQAVYGETPEWSDITALSEEVIFSHKVHHDADIGCAECHKGIEGSRTITSQLRVSKKDCMECHERSDEYTDNACGVCHRDITEDWTPPSHQQNWKLLHGDIVKARPDQNQHQCSLCHTESSCNECHRKEAPRNHNTFWAQRGHGIMAGMDRGDCMVCHQVDACDRCHRQTAPRNHTGMWDSPLDRHCFSCHLPLQNEGCSVCHPSDRAHRVLSPAMPTNRSHVEATEADCRECHTPVKLAHPDNGDDCRACHR